MPDSTSNRRRSIKLISFDLDDTLWAVGPVILQANLCLYHWLQQYAPRFTDRFTLDDFGTLRRIVITSQPEIEHSVTATRIAVLQYGLNQSGYKEKESEALAATAFEVFLQARNRVELFAHANQMLTDLSANYRIVALSNGNADVRMAGLGQFFEFSLNADQVGRAKPDPLMFEQMLERAEVSADQVVHIGDHPEHDIAGAQRCGLRTLWVNFAGAPWPGAAPPDLQASCLSEVAGLIDSLS